MRGRVDQVSSAITNSSHAKLKVNIATTANAGIESGAIESCQYAKGPSAVEAKRLFQLFGHGLEEPAK